jgi:acetate kinase
MKILVLNSGSSSLKSSLYDLHTPLPALAPNPLWQGEIEWGGNDAEIKIATSAGAKSKQNIKVGSREEASRQLLATLWTGSTRVIASAKEIEVVGHRVVNGGPDHHEPARLDAKVKAAIEAAAVFAPLHNQAELDGIAIAEKEIPGVPQVAVFDTGFHRTLSQAAYVYPGPYEWLAKGIRRYGFHGINHGYIAERAPQILQRDARGLRIVSCHLGNGCSLAAIRDGRSVDTTMGFTPLEGLMMGTRSGSVDPGILTYLMRQEKQTGEQLDDLLNKKSGLLGISGFSGDMREIIDAMKNAGANAPDKANPQRDSATKNAGDAKPALAAKLQTSADDKALHSKLAFDIFVHRLRREIGAMIAVLGGIDGLVFTAGIGENSSDVRAAACEPFAFAGIHLDAAKNAQSPADADISAAASAVRVLVVKAQEDWAIARDCFRIAGKNQ